MRLEGWDAVMVLPTTARGLPRAIETGASRPPQGEVVLGVVVCRAICRAAGGSLTRVASRGARNFPNARSHQTNRLFRRSAARRHDLPAARHNVDLIFRDGLSRGGTVHRKRP